MPWNKETGLSHCVRVVSLQSDIIFSALRWDGIYNWRERFFKKKLAHFKIKISNEAQVKDILENNTVKITVKKCSILNQFLK